MRGKEQAAPAGHAAFGITPAYAGKSLIFSLFFRNRQDHPRVCGEKTITGAYVGDRAGSPPRMRGKERQGGRQGTRRRITPAYAGKRAVHPVHDTVSRGSPPRMRGKAYSWGKAHHDKRITPAYAGKRPLPAPTLATVRDHPRVCGEKSVKAAAKERGVGSPPRMRGKGQFIRFTILFHGDHPRVCGEKHTVGAKHIMTRGSPPRMRGKGFSTSPMYRFFRITPAYAGKSVSCFVMSIGSEDHPRVCGEKFCVAQKPCCIWGSPPRMRGKAPLPAWLALVLRITPAYAGKRGQQDLRCRADQDHPRVCGEKQSQTLSGRLETGSPPRMRGKAVLILDDVPGVGITPAYAGKSPYNFRINRGI